MSGPALVRWWPVIGLAGLILLGLAVGTGSTPVDDAVFAAGQRHPWLEWLRVFTDGRVTLALWTVVLAVAVAQRRARLAAVIAAAPVVAVLTERLAKQAFGRLRDDALAYPSGHTTLVVVVLGLAVLVVGVSVWAVAAAATVVAAGALGQGVTYHYFTDAVGAVLLGTVLVCVAARAARS